MISAIVKFINRKKCDVLMLGASEESFLKRAIYGNIPYQIIQEVDCTVLVFRSAK